MIPGNVDPRRAEKVQRYKVPQQANGNAPVEDLTPDYMNILGPDTATANADGLDKCTSADCLQPQQQQLQEDLAAGGAGMLQEAIVQTTNGTSVIPTSPQYGVAIISGGADVPTETTTPSTNTLVETTARGAPAAAAAADDGKDMHSTPSRNDRFKVVKIASLEPFRRGRWKCMDYVDENPPHVAQQQQQAKQTQSATSIQQLNSVQYMQTQSLPQQHFQQLLVQGAFSGSPQPFYQGQLPPQSQYFYPPPAAVNLHALPVQGGSMQPPAAFINNPPYFPNAAAAAAAGYTTYANVQYVPSNLIQTQSSAFVPTSQNVPANFQQSQTYAGPPSATTASSQQQQQPPPAMVNGHAFPASDQSQQPPQQAGIAGGSSLPTQIAKNVILQPAAALVNQPVSVSQPQQYNPVYNPSTMPTNQSPQAGASMVNHNAIANPALVAAAANQPTTTTTTTTVNFSQMPSIAAATQSQQNYELANAVVYTNPQFTAATGESSVDGKGDGTLGAQSETTASAESVENAGGEDPAKANPLVNAIDNKIEQAMDLVKSHLMYTVREEVEVLKEKIVELMERIQQLETENALLRQQIPKAGAPPTATPANGSASATNGSTPDPSHQQQQQQPPPPLSTATQSSSNQQQ